jgi:D-glycero-alpha-D-manno-heptose-7-phosphate kinase
MIVTKTPLRVSFFGGGTDLPEYFNSHTGKVLSAAINVYMHIAINETPHKRVKACYDEIELVDTAGDVKHARIRESLLKYGVYNNIEVSSFCHIPTKGTGLGSSSSFTVGLCTALQRRSGMNVIPGDIAETAYDIERNRCGEKLGKQDQYAAAYGGLNYYTFDGPLSYVEPVIIDDRTWRTLENNLMFFYTGVRRDANDILKKQASNTVNGSNYEYLKELARCAEVGADYLREGKLNKFGTLLDHGWTIKRQMQDGISNGLIDECYDSAIEAGARGGKLLGAGGGGYLMFYVEPDRQQAVREAIKLQEYKFKFSKTGTEVVYEHNTAY